MFSVPRADTCRECLVFPDDLYEAFSVPRAEGVFSIPRTQGAFSVARAEDL